MYLLCRNSKAPFTFVLQLMVPGPPYLSLTMAWAAEYDPSAALGDAGTPKSPEGPDGESDSELSQSPFDLCLARCSCIMSARAWQGKTMAARPLTWRGQVQLHHSLPCKRF